MDDEKFNLSMRKFLKQVGVTAQQEIEKVVRGGQVSGDTLKVKAVLTSEDGALEHVVEGVIDIK
ncbi:MAG: DUF6494 family protein [Pseudomonadota bacterium]